MVNSWDEALNGMKNLEAWPLYGSRLSPDDPHLFLSYVLNNITDDYKLEYEIPEDDIDQVDLSEIQPYEHSDALNGLLSVKTLDKRNYSGYWFPVILSLHYRKGITKRLKNKKVKETKANDFLSRKIPLPRKVCEQRFSKWFFF